MTHAHTHESAPVTPEQRAIEHRAQRVLLGVLAPIVLATVIALVALWPHDVSASLTKNAPGYANGNVTFATATIATITPTSCSGADGATGPNERCAAITATLEGGAQAKLMLPSVITPESVHVGQKIRVTKLTVDGNTSYQFHDFPRSGTLIAFGVAFVVAVGLVARRRGLLALVGLAFAMLMVWKFVLPSLLVGHDPVATGLVGGAAIMIVALYTAHGFSIRTTTALVGTLAGLVMVAGLGVAAQHFGHLTGVTGDDDLTLSAYAPHLDLRSMVTASIILAGLGVLNDVTITQSSAVWELAATETDRRAIFTRAMRIGRDHIASTVYTIAFATAGAATATLLLAMVLTQGSSLMLQSEPFAEEILRTCVAAIALAAAMPVTTAIAVAAVSLGGGLRAGEVPIEPAAEPTDAEPPRSASPARPVATPQQAAADADAAYRRPREPG